MAVNIKSQHKLWEALASLHRRRLMRLLLQAELCVLDLKGVLGWPQSTTSRHLLYLEKGGFLRARKDGLWRYYRLRPPVGSVERSLWGVLLNLGGAPYGSDERAMKSRLAKLEGIKEKKYSARKRPD